MALGALMLDLEGIELSNEEKEKLQHPACGGVILFTRNYIEPKQLSHLTQQIKKASKTPVLIAVDQEGGRVQRFRNHFQAIPPMAWLGQFYNDNPQEALKATADFAWLMATELAQYQIDFSFAPVLDIDYQRSEVIGNRAFHQNPESITALSIAWRQGALDAGMISVAKHFPGHGFVSADSHTDLPRDSRPLEDIAKKDIQPFMELIQYGLEGIMPAHIIYDQADPQPAGFSSFWLNTILRQQLGFNGVIFSDDLTMAAAEMAGTYSERAAMALSAGCDMILVCNNPQGAAEVLDSLSQYQNKTAEQRLNTLYAKPKTTQPLFSHPRWKAVEAWLNLYEHNALLGKM